MICLNCNQDKDEFHDFYKKKNGEIFLTCKNCIQNKLKTESYFSFIDLCQAFDIPFIYDEVIYVYHATFQRGGSPFGKYLSKMKLCAYKPFGFNDSLRIKQQYSLEEVLRRPSGAHMAEIQNEKMPQDFLNQNLDN